MPPIEVNLHTDADFITTWGPVIIAVVSLVGVLIASNVNANAARAAAKTSAESVIDAERVRALNEDRRHARSLVAAAASAARERSDLVAQHSYLWHHDLAEEHWSDEKQARMVATYNEMFRAVALIRLTTDDETIRGALDDLATAVATVRTAIEAGAPRQPGWLEGVTAACTVMDEAADALVTAAAPALVPEKVAAES
ncbi:hypothetical protein ACFQ80_01580 [Isoptericola sp. NPDC056578]|uniref:hypothetical protein n=1 Tax=Isoptericola sp. NPDC056578 TaxID=3345870 RepID=UPI0036ACC6D9